MSEPPVLPCGHDVVAITSFFDSEPIRYERTCVCGLRCCPSCDRVLKDDECPNMDCALFGARQSDEESA